MTQRNGNPRVSVVVPTRNEARNLEVVLPAIAAVRPSVHEIIVVDGDSVDGTVETAHRVLPGVKVVLQTRKGKGNAMACGFAAVTGDVVVMFDADGSADPAEIPAFVRALVAGADFAKGSRFIRGGGSDDITLLRKSGNAGLNGVANALFGTSYTDLCYGYNAFWADILPVLDLPPIDRPAPAQGMLWGDGFEIETVLNCRVAAAGLKITEVPSMERERIFGQTNLRTFADGTRVLRTLAAERKRAVRRTLARRQMEEQARAATPPAGIPAVPPTPVAVSTPVRGIPVVLPTARAERGVGIGRRIGEEASEEGAVTQFSAGELSRARTARRLVALLLIVAGIAACLMNFLKVGGLFADTRLIVTTVFLILGPGWCAAGFLRRAPAAHVWLLCVGVGVSVTLLVAQIMVSFKDWQPTAALYIVTGLCIPFLLRHAVVAQ